MTKQYLKKYKEIIVYVIMGSATTFVNWAVYSLIVKYVDVNIAVANIIAWIISVIFAYFTNKIWVFNNHNWMLKYIFYEAFLFVSTRVLSGMVEVVGLQFLVNIGVNQKIFGIEGSVAKIIISIFVVIFNYVTSKLIIFKKKNGNPVSL